jgi:hypothetical protein
MCIALCIVVGLYLVIDFRNNYNDSIDYNMTGVSTSSHSRDKFYTAFLEIVTENSQSTDDEEATSSSVVGTPSKTPTGSSSSTNNLLTTTGPATEVSSAGISVNGKATTSTVTVDGKTVYLYDGVPSEWSAASSSVYIAFAEIEPAWREGYKSAFGHDYPNSVQYGGWHKDSFINTNNPKMVNTTGPTWDDGGVTCIGFCPNVYYSDNIFRWNGTGEVNATYNYRWVIVVQNSSGQILYLPAIPSDTKAHVWPGGCFQTYIRHKSDNGTFDMPKTAKKDAAVSLEADKMDIALSYLEDGTAGAAYSTTRNSVVQANIEIYYTDGNKLNMGDWTAIGVIRVE